MSNIIQFPVIAGVEITTDSAGRFNLNALHRASGLGSIKAPAQWLRTQTAKDLIEFAQKKTMQICIESIEGRNGGTFVHENIAIEYAGWISTEFRWLVNQTFIDYRTGKLAPVVPTTLSEALRLAADLNEAKEKALLERDEAIRTKALIGSKREATAMATAAAAIKRADKFAELAGDSKRYKQVKAIPWLLEMFAPSKGMYQQMGKLLGKISAELNYDVLKIDDSEYGQVKAYHVDVILEAKCRIDYSDELMGKYRNSKEGEAA
jgi:hypothetical protein